MSNFVNLLDIMYPVGSVYITTGTSSPADVVGGTWTQINDKSCLMSDPDNVGNYSGSSKITVDQMPSHRHGMTSKFTGNNNKGDYNDQIGGNSLDGSAEFYARYTHYTGGGKDYYPYSFAAIIYYRIA